MWSASLLSLAAVLSAATAALQGFNYGASFADNTPKHQADFEYEFNAAKQLHGTNGQFTSARIYTMIQSGTTNELIEAIPAAVNTHTTLLLGLWASGGPELFANEIAMLQKAVQLYGTAFTDLVVGISVGSEDLYRISPTGIKNLSGVGAGPDTLVSYIQLVRATIQTTGLARKPIGHVDTWTAYVNQSNNALIDAVDWIGVDAYPYFQTTMVNDIVSANKSFYDAYDYTVRVSLGKPVWVTETGWPVSGPSAFMAVASAENARIYWEDVSCSLISKGINLYYYTLQDVQMGAPSPSFGIMPGGDLSQVNPLFDLTCGANTVSTLSISVLFLLLSSALSPLLLLFLYNLSIISSALSPFLPAPSKCGPCACTPSTQLIPVPTERVGPWIADANRYAKVFSSSTASSTEILTRTESSILTASNKVSTHSYALKTDVSQASCR
ncbi:glycoside hydrolase superfamily [Clohesyomyces aquaticus]|uniref:Probable glucan endo-1,3-beta-glucosidase eglC n=1 Tax=Clohesyomyces aquaticus TaxID=1231657 RepID=A0A1Y1ZZ85_9PLEO|nr:glycoside hydrolase superfamily [Clohesyomyces aquaticus]